MNAYTGKYWIGLALVTSLGLTACNEKEKAGLFDCNIAAMDDGQKLLFVQGIGCGSLFASSSSPSGTAAEEAATTTTEPVGGFEVVVPSEEIVTAGTSSESNPDGDFDGFTFQGNGTPISGFVGSVPAAGTTNATDLGSQVITDIGNLTEVNTVNIISTQTIPNVTDTVVYQVGLATLNNHTATELSNILLSEVGTTVDPGSVSNLPDSQSIEGSGDDFRVVIQVTQNAGGDSLVGIGAALNTDYSGVEAELVGFLDGTNVGNEGSSVIASSADFTAGGAAQADFLWVVDNSGSMSQEQASVIANASNFFDRMTATGVDFSIGVITTDSSTLRGTGFTSDKTEFETAVNAGISGSGTEAGIYHAEAALKAGGSVDLAGKASDKLTVVFLSDEGDHYACETGGSKNNGNPACTGGTAFDQATNIFLDLSVKAYSIIGLDAGTGQAGTCDGGVAKATSGNNADTSYFDLAANTGGSSASICNTDYSAILENIATQAAAAASDYTLTETPISSSILVKVNGVEVERSLQNGFFYNSASNSIIFTGSAIPSVGDTIEASYNRFQ